MIKIDLDKEKIAQLKGNVIRVECPILEKEKTQESTEMEAGQEIICLGCPMACRIRVFTDKQGEVTEIKGHQCKIGKEYAKKEIQCPERVLTATVRTNDPQQPLLPVRTSQAIPKKLLFEVMVKLSEIVVDQPVKVGEVVKNNLLDQQIDIIASLDFPFEYSTEEKIKKINK